MGDSHADLLRHVELSNRSNNDHITRSTKNLGRGLRGPSADQSSISGPDYYVNSGNQRVKNGESDEDSDEGDQVGTASTDATITIDYDRQEENVAVAQASIEVENSIRDDMTKTAARKTAESTTSSATQEETKPKRKSVVGYYSPQKFYERNGLSRPEYLDFTKLTRVNYASFQADEDGHILGSDSFVDPLVLFGPVNWNPSPGAKEYCHKTTNSEEPICRTYHYEKGLIGGAHMNGCDVYATVGGDGSSDEVLSMMAWDKDARKNFTNSCVWLIENYDFDGIDFAWELSSASSQDMINFNTLLTEVRQALDDLALERPGKTYGLTAELPCILDNFYNLDIIFLNAILTEFNIMTYDFFVDGIAYVNSPLHGPAGDPASVSGCVGSYLSRGAKKDKINIALPFFGKSFRGARAMGEQCIQDWQGLCGDTLTWVEDKGSPQYYHIYKKLGSMATSFDEQTKTLYAINDESILSYDNEYSTCLKTEYALGMGLNGVVIRDLAGDFLDDSSTPLLDALHAKMTNPTLHCDSKELWYATVGVREVVKVVDIDEAVNTDADSFASKETNTKSTEESPTSGYMYMCGHGEVDAAARCDSNTRESSACPGGLGDCQVGEMCFLVFCDEPTTMGVQTEEVEPEGLDAAELGEVAVISEAMTEESFQHTCGFGEDDAHTRCNSLDWVDIPCHGLTPCPNGMMCFWTQCNKSETFVKPLPKPKPRRKPLSGVGDPSSSKGPPPNPPTTTTLATTTTSTTTTTTTATTKPPYTGVLYLQFKCGESRDDAAATCSEACTSTWGCSPGKQCFSVPCPFSH